LKSVKGVHQKSSVKPKVTITDVTSDGQFNLDFDQNMVFPLDKNKKIDSKFLNLLLDVHIVSSINGELIQGQIETSRR
jgi:hypothetical protein